VKTGKEAKEIKETKCEKQTSGDASRVAAFFDLDGTLLAPPSLEQRFFRTLRYRREIPRRNYLLWLQEAARLAPQGIQEMLQANKAYLRGVRMIHEWDAEDSEAFLAFGGRRDKGQEQASPRCEPGSGRRDSKLPVPAFFPQGVERAAWHVKQGHAIVLVSGTLEPLARQAARSLEAGLAARGAALTIHVCATRLEEKDGQWTGNVLGEAMRGRAKARAARRLAAEQSFDLSECFAYGNSAADEWLLAAVGKPAAANPSSELMRIARMQGWPVLRWSESQDPVHKPRRSRSSQGGSNQKKSELLKKLECKERHELEEEQFVDEALVRTGDHGIQDE